MSNSRLEKFIYAICSMEVSDLPAPLSRIEILWNCLITGETPDFEPQSRNEQYLMAMLGLYELENLPTPMSRGEKLLYKIAMGETDLSDVPGYLSRYEELLKYLIENGGIGDFEYVLYTLNQSLSTLYQTVEKPVKSAILKGQTLVNLVTNYGFGGDNNLYEYRFYDQPIQSRETLTVFVVNPNISTIKIGLHHASTGEWAKEITYDVSNVKKITYTISLDNYNCKYVGVVVPNAFESTGFENGLVIVRGDQSHLEVNTYFDGMQSVKMPVLTTSNVIQRVEFETITANFSDGSITPIDSEKSASGCIEYFDISKLTNAKFVFRTTQAFKIENYFSFFFYDKDMNYLKCVNGELTKVGDGVYSSTIPTVENAKYLRVIKYDGESQMSNIIKSSISAFVDNSLSIDPTFSIKTNILTVNEDVKLRGIGDVQDTLDLMTGEVTERIGEIVLDGSQKMVLNHTLDDVLGFYMESKIVGSSYLKYLMCDKLPVKPIYNVNEEGIRAIGSDSPFRLYFTISKSKLSSYDVDGLNNYLKQNPITVHYRLITESIKTVDLTTVDQDGQSTKLKSFNDVTHVEIKADNLIPSVNVEVATKIEETLSTLGLDHHDISETQNKLSQTIDEQSENTDATMMATTEIYEQIL